MGSRTGRDEARALGLGEHQKRTSFCRVCLFPTLFWRTSLSHVKTWSPIPVFHIQRAGNLVEVDVEFRGCPYSSECGLPLHHLPTVTS